QMGGAGSSDGRVTVQENAWLFQMEEAPVKLAWDLVERADPEKLLSFRMTDIPLPAPPALTPVPPAPSPQPLPPIAGEDHPYFERGGGTLVSRVQFGEKAAAEGELSIGLAAKSGAGWSPVRWTRVEVDAQGVARLSDLKPGTYRLMRSYRPPAGAAP